MSFPRYPEYKDSGVEWLGEVPGHWSVTALKRGFDVTLGKMLQPDSTGPDDELLPYLRAANIQWDGVDATDIKQMWLTKRDRAQLRLEYGDLLVSEGGDVGRSCMWAAEIEHCYFQNSVNRVRARDGHSNRYLYYWMSTVKDKGYIDVLCNKSTIAHFTAEKVAAVPVPLPTSVEQPQIAAFLDRETAKIDALVAEQRRLMALLKEKRQAVISHAVTQGLNLDAPMKPSGIEWLGDVPEHWNVGGLTRFIGPVVDYRGRTPTKVDEGIFLVTARNVRDGKIDYEASEEFVDPESAASLIARGKPEIGDLLFTMEAPLGQVALIDRTDIALAQRIVKFRGTPNVMQNRYLLYWFMSTHCQARLETLATGSTALGIKASKLGMIECLVPPMSEQAGIADHIEQANVQFDTLTTEAQRAIDLLQERRTALISAAVTGQIDVRGAVL
ncbi:restriction endonuclease subunit S [Rhodoferax sp.]|uniref:restriction endonuclease subunit S n=1 Tax=Rhodoferax sp. TaxID=50421 RepID=UPI002619DCEE|nr:restriction endonuclease subunit S [Rhodoferax sp.]MDD2809363.1 restriction endonuclease subunit S [Rhodoferax sp.]